MKRVFFVVTLFAMWLMEGLVPFSSGPVGAVRPESGSERPAQLAVSVWDADGKPVTNLRREDFTVLEQGAPQTITRFITPTAPLRVVLLVDTSGSMARTFQRVQIGLIEFVSLMGSFDELAVISFATSPRLETDFSFSSERVKQSLRDLQLGRERFEITRLYDALKPVLDRLQDSGQDIRKALVLVTDGDDRGSQQDDRKSSLRLAGQRRIPFFVFQSQGRESKYLRELAEVTAGGFYRDEKLFEKHLEDVARHVRYHYVIGYTSSALPAKDRTIGLQVQTSRSNLRVMAPVDYRIPPDG